MNLLWQQLPGDFAGGWMGGKSVKEIFTLKRDLPAAFAKVFFASCFSPNVFW